MSTSTKVDVLKRHLRRTGWPILKEEFFPETKIIPAYWLIETQNFEYYFSGNKNKFLVAKRKTDEELLHEL